MSTTDSLERFIFDKLPIRGEFVHLQQSFQQILQQHPYPPAIQRLLGEALCTAALLSAVIKFHGRLTVQFRGKGKLKLLLAQCNNHFHLRGLAKWEGDFSYDDLMESFNAGILTITLDSRKNKQPYQGIISWQGNSLAESIEHYFRHSEQLETKIWLSVNETSAAGYLLQIIPEKENSFIQNTKDIINLEWNRIIETTSRLSNSDMLDSLYPDFLLRLYPRDEIRLFPAKTVYFHCTCNRERGENAILLLGKEEAEAELNNNKSIVVTCDFCNTKYVFDRVDVGKIFETQSKPPSAIH